MRVFQWVVVIATIVICVLVTRWLYITVMASGMPDWLKYLILR